MARKRKIIVCIATSADGFIARRDGSVDWLDRPRAKGDYGMGVFYKSIDTILWGRKTCDMALDFQKKGVPGSEFDTRVKNYVFTRGPLPATAPPGVEFVNEPEKREKYLDDGWRRHHCFICRRARDRRVHNSRDPHIYRRRYSTDRSHPSHRTAKAHLVHEVH
jgi:hypothetical protein